MLKKVTIQNMRTYKNTQLEFHPGLNVIVGDNGSGKTTIPEAIVLALGGKIPNVTQKSLHPLRWKGTPSIHVELCGLSVDYSSDGCIVRRGTEDPLANTKRAAASVLKGLFEQDPQDVMRLRYIPAKGIPFEKGRLDRTIFEIIGLERVFVVIDDHKEQIKLQKKALNPAVTSEFKLVSDEITKLTSTMKASGPPEAVDHSDELEVLETARANFNSGVIDEVSELKGRYKRLEAPDTSFPTYDYSEHILCKEELRREEESLSRYSELEVLKDPLTHLSHDEEAEYALSLEIKRFEKAIASDLTTCDSCLQEIGDKEGLYKKLKVLTDQRKDQTAVNRYVENKRALALKQGLEEKRNALRSNLARFEERRKISVEASTLHAAYEADQSVKQKLIDLKPRWKSAKDWSPERYALLQEETEKYREASAEWRVYQRSLRAKLQRLGSLKPAAQEELKKERRIEQVRDLLKSLLDWKETYEASLYPALSQTCSELASRLLDETVVIGIANKGLTIGQDGVIKDLESHSNMGLRDTVALSLRLSLLKHFKPPGLNPGFVMMDEVTAFMDQKTRPRLAETLSQVVDDLEQIIVLTHDQSIMEHADHCIHVTKVDGVSQCVMT